MRKLFSIGLMSIAAVTCFQAHAGDCQKPKTVSIPDTGTSLVYIGNTMPKNGCFVVAVNKNGLKIPASEKEAVDEIVKSLPNWMYVAIGSSYGDTQCIVLVNKLDYFDLIVSMWVEYWRRQSINNPEFLGVPSFESDYVVDRLQEESCKKIKSEMPGAFKFEVEGDPGN